MTDVPEEKTSGRRSQQNQECIIRGSKYLGNILDLLRTLRHHHDCPNRILHYDEYAAYLLLYFFSPLVTSLRGLQQAVNIESIRESFHLRRFSLGSFSEAGSVFNPELLKPIIDQLLGEMADLPEDTRWACVPLHPVAVDGTLLRALPKMVWALWVDEEHRAAKMHLEFSLLKGVPIDATVTHGNANERSVLRRNLTAGKLYVMDAGYAQYDLLEQILQIGSSFLVHLRDNASYDMLEERPISPQAAKAGIERDLIVHLGSERSEPLHQRPLRLIQIHVKGTSHRPSSRVSSKKTFRTTCQEYTLLLTTDLLDVDAELLAAMYSYRWQIELFFRWFKKILKAEHLLSLNLNGLTIMMYCAIIASLLVTLWTGRRPNKRTYEMLAWYFAGMASEQELIAHILKLRSAAK